MRSKAFYAALKAVREYVPCVHAGDSGFSMRSHNFEAEARLRLAGEIESDQIVKEFTERGFVNYAYEAAMDAKDE